jgi:hypothetical protein
MLITKRNINKDELILLVEKYNSAVDLIERIMKDLYTSVYYITQYSHLRHFILAGVTLQNANDANAAMNLLFT